MRRQQKPNPQKQIRIENTKFIMISFNKDGKSQLVASQPGAKWSFPPGLALQKHSPDLVSKPDINKIQHVEYKNQNAKKIKSIQRIWFPNQPIKTCFYLIFAHSQLAITS